LTGVNSNTDSEVLLICLFLLPNVLHEQEWHLFCLRVYSKNTHVTKVIRGIHNANLTQGPAFRYFSCLSDTGIHYPRAGCQASACRDRIFRATLGVTDCTLASDRDITGHHRVNATRTALTSRSFRQSPWAGFQYPGPFPQGRLIPPFFLHNSPRATGLVRQVLGTAAGNRYDSAFFYYEPAQRPDIE